MHNGVMTPSSRPQPLSSLLLLPRMRLTAQTLAAHPGLVNARDRRGRTFLQLVVQLHHDPELIEVVMGGSHTLSLARDNHGRSALLVALHRNHKTFVRRLLQAVVAGRVPTLPEALAPLAELLPEISRVHPKAFVQFVRDMPLDEEPQVCPPTSKPTPTFWNRHKPKSTLMRPAPNSSQHAAHACSPPLVCAQIRDEDETDLEISDLLTLAPTRTQVLDEDETELDIDAMLVRGHHMRCPVPLPYFAGLWSDLAQSIRPARAMHSTAGGARAHRASIRASSVIANAKEDACNQEPL